MTKFFFILILAIILLSQCNSAEKENCVKPDAVNPNGSSELSLLMRQMHDEAAEMKLLIEQGKQPENFPAEFNNINVAEPTDSATKKPSFEAFADNYLTALKTVYHSEEGAVIEKYNTMINACLACHSDHCPGPVPKIKKLMISEMGSSN